MDPEQYAGVERLSRGNGYQQRSKMSLRGISKKLPLSGELFNFVNEAGACGDGSVRDRTLRVMI